MSIELEKVIGQLSSDCGYDLVFVKQLENGVKTARSAEKYLLEDELGKKYLLELGIDKTQRFYIERAYTEQSKPDWLFWGFCLNIPKVYKFTNSVSFVLYEYFDRFKEVKDRFPIEAIENYYSVHSRKLDVSVEVVESILKEFLKSWPSKYHPSIRRLPEFEEYSSLLFGFKSLVVGLEHGDFSTNNILLVGGSYFLMDFEFSRDLQPIGFDVYDYCQSLRLRGSDVNYNFLEGYEALHESKYDLINVINDAVDKNTYHIQIYEDFKSPALVNAWNVHYINGYNYNLSFDWCHSWSGVFLKDDARLHIVTFWNDDKLAFLAPMYRVKNRLYLIGSNPDLFDEYSFMYVQEKYLKKFFDYVKINKFLLDVRYLNMESDLAKFFIKYLYQNQIDYESEVIDTKPFLIIEEFKPSAKDVSDITRLKNRALKKYSKTLKFEFSVDKTPAELDSFIKMHVKRWNGGPFKDTQGLSNFLHCSAKSESLILSKLSLNSIPVAFHIGRMASNGSYCSLMPAYSTDFSDISPGKVLLFEMLNYCKQNQVTTFDFGRGAEAYKYWFSEESCLLLNLRTESNSVFLKFSRIISKVVKKIGRIFYG